MGLSRYSHKFSKAVTLVENKPKLADKISKEFFCTVEEQSTAVLESFQPNSIHTKKGLDTWDSDMPNHFKSS